MKISDFASKIEIPRVQNADHRRVDRQLFRQINDAEI